MLHLATALLMLCSIPSGTVAQDPARASAAAQELEEIGEHERLGVQLLNALRGKDTKLFADLLDAEALVERAVGGLGLDSAFQKGWRWGAIVGLRLAWAEDFPDLSDEAKFTVDLVRVRGAARERSLLLRRRDHPGSRFDYLELWTERGADGQLRVVDWISHVNGQRRSERIRLDLLTSPQELKRPDPQNLAGIDRAYFDNAELVRRLTRRVKKEDWQKTLAGFEQLPPELRREPWLRLAEMRIAAWLGDAARVLGCYEVLTADRPEYVTADLWAFAHDLWGKDEPRVLASVRRLRTAIGGDSQLDYIESDLLVARGELAAANELALRARASEPDWSEPHWMVVSIALLRHDPGTVLQGLLEIDRRFQVQWQDLNEQAAYKEFAASPQGAEWRRYLAAKK